jgi:hypothetical protein
MRQAAVKNVIRQTLAEVLFHSYFSGSADQILSKNRKYPTFLLGPKTKKFFRKLYLNTKYWVFLQCYKLDFFNNRCLFLQVPVLL